jgi:hypothetical protein
MHIDRSKFLSICLSMIPVVTLAGGCGGSGDDGTGSGGSDLSEQGGKAAAAAPQAPGSAAKAPAASDVVTVNTNPVSIQEEECKVDVKAPVVSIPTNKAAEAAINGVLAPLSVSPCGEGGFVGRTSSFEVTANGQGLLSILVTGVESPKGAGNEAVLHTYNFDVKNGGKQLELVKVLTADGIAAEKDACVLKDPANEGIGPEVGQEDCSISLTTSGELPTTTPSFEPQWVARANGLEIEAGTDHSHGDFFSTAVAWKDLEATGLTPNTVVADFAKAQK